VSGDPPADDRYTRVRLSPIGELVLACEQHRVGPVPIGLVDGSLYSGGTAPPLDPTRALRRVSALVDDETIPNSDLQEMVGLPSVPTGAAVQGDLEGLYAGRSARLLQSCCITREQMPPGHALVITGTLERWVRGVWPVTIETTCRFEGGIGAVLRAWADACRVDRSGLDELTRLIS
jgi:hypothetical protein